MSGRPTSRSTRTAKTYRGIAYGARALGRRSARSSRRSHDLPGRPGKPATGRRGTGGLRRPASRGMRNAERRSGAGHHPDHWRAGCEETRTPCSGRGRRKRTRTTGTSPAADFTRRAGTGNGPGATRTPRPCPTQPQRHGGIIAQPPETADHAGQQRVPGSGTPQSHPQHQCPDRLRVGGRPGWRWVQRRATRWACQRSRVLGDTSRNRRSWVGSSLLRALRTARSSQVSVGRGLRRRSTATS
jgi:hypothetical protein